MIYLQLFLTFLEVGAVSFGGGYGMISLIREKVLMQGWLNEGELLNLIAVAESTPGPIAVNMATFVGSTQGGAMGSLLATFGVVLPSFVIILLISAVIHNFFKYEGVKAFLNGVRPAVVGLITGTAVTMILSKLFGIKQITSAVSVDRSGILIFVLIVLLDGLWKKTKKKKMSPIHLILISAVLGILFRSGLADIG